MLSTGRTGSLRYVKSSALASLSKQSACYGLTKPMQPSIFFFFLSFICHLCNGSSAALITVGVIVTHHVHVKKVLQLPLQGLKCGPVLFLLLPAVNHDVIQDFRAAGRTWHPVAQRDLLDHLQVCHGYNNHSTQSGPLIKRREHMYKLEQAHLGKASVRTSWSRKAKSQRTRHLI